MIEYVLMVTAVLLVCIYFFANHSSSSLSNSVNATLNSIVNQVDNLNSQITFPGQS